MRTPKQPGWRVAGGALEMMAGDVGVGDHGQPAFVGRRQMHVQAEASTLLTFRPAEGAEAGLVAVQDDDHFLGVGLTRVKGALAVRAFSRDGAEQPAAGRTIALVPVTAGPVRLRVVARGGRYDLDYAAATGVWRTVAHGVDGTILSTKRAGGFTGTVVGPFARGAAQ